MAVCEMPDVAIVTGSAKRCGQARRASSTPSIVAAAASQSHLGRLRFARNPSPASTRTCTAETARLAVANRPVTIAAWQISGPAMTSSQPAAVSVVQTTRVHRPHMWINIP